MRRGRPAGDAPQEGEMLRREILQLLDDTMGRRNWAHSGLTVALKGLRLEEATWEPAAGHSVWEQINHIAHWKRYIVRRVRGTSSGTNQAWPAAGRTPADLRKAIAGLTALHDDLRRAVMRLSAGELTRKRRRFSHAQLLLGGAAHESYHIGQIFQTRKLYRVRRAGSA